MRKDKRKDPPVKFGELKSLSKSKRPKMNSENTHSFTVPANLKDIAELFEGYLRTTGKVRHNETITNIEFDWDTPRHNGEVLLKFEVKEVKENS